MKKRRKSKLDGRQIFSIFMFLVFIGSTFGFALFFSGGNSKNSGKKFLNENIFDEPVDYQTKIDAITPVNPNLYPEIPLERKLGGVWIEYSCNNCSEIVNELEDIVNLYYPRVYVSPSKRERNETIFLISPQETKLMEFNRTEIEDFICRNLIYPPDICTLRNL